MSNKPNSRRGPRSSSVRAVLGCAAVVCAALGGAGGCTAYATYKNPPTSCAPQDGSASVTAAYEFKTIDSFEGEMAPNFFNSMDSTPGSAMNLTLGSPPIGAPCGSATALQIQTFGNDDWGSLMGYNNFGPRDGSGYEGLSFWARTVGNSNGTVTILFDDPNTYNNNTAVTDGGIIPPTPPTADCTKYKTPDGGATGGAVPVDPMTGMPLGSGILMAPLPPNGCGNDYQTMILVSGDWQLITIPFGAFQQAPTPNQVPNNALKVVGSAYGTSLITSRLMLFTLRFPKAVETNLWIDDIAFYRHKGWAPAGLDGGVDAP